jgi:23S rRNA (cytosine1962-C5)-methyltransferase
MEKNFPLIFDRAVEGRWKLKEEGTIVNLKDQEDQFIGRGYYGIQNKGIGWILTYKEKEKIDRKFFQKKLITALNKRKDFFYKDETTCFRVFNSIGDGIGGLTIDYYEDYFLFNWYSEGIYYFKDLIYDIFKNLVYYRGIYQKKRFDDKGKYIEDDDFVMGDRGDFPITVKESGVKIAVNLNDGPMVGFFLDQRETRKKLMEKYTEGMDVLNTFSYTGIFSVFATLGGAKSTTSVDLANRSLEKTKEQFELNEISLENNHIVVEDIFEYFEYAEKKSLKFDIVILDPPSFAKSKNFIFKADKDYKILIKNSLKIMKEKGIIAASTNMEKMDIQKFKSEIGNALKEENKKYKFIEEFRLPEDFQVNTTYPEGNYLKVLFIEIY